MSNILLIDVDKISDKKLKIPNLALMQISAWHKQGKRDIVGLVKPLVHIHEESSSCRGTHCHAHEASQGHPDFCGRDRDRKSPGLASQRNAENQAGL
jgi:hypothetical protein